MTFVEIASTLGVAESTVRRAVKGDAWREHASKGLDR